MRLSELTPDLALAALLDGRLIVHTSETESHAVKVFSENAQPNVGLGNEFVRIRANGNPDPLSRGADGFGLWNGNVMAEILCRSNSDGTIKRNRNSSLISQIEGILGSGASSDRFFFRLDGNNPITPPTPNLTNGYYTTILNVWWRNTND